MSGSRLAREPWALIGFFALAAGCQSYNFNPVGSCMLQPGRTEFTLSDISTADVLFVVDDSNSMSAEQQLLANAFDSYIGNLDSVNQARADSGLEPFDFHIAVTTTSVFYNGKVAATCRSDCPGATGLVCCRDALPNQPAKGPRRCTLLGQSTECVAGTGATCALDCNNYWGEKVCCTHSAPGLIPPNNPASLTEVIPCSVANRACGDLTFHFQSDLSGCVPGAALAQFPYASGDFVSQAPKACTGPTDNSCPVGTACRSTCKGLVGLNYCCRTDDTIPWNPRVLHFDKSLYPDPSGTATNRQGFTRAELMSFFKKNVVVGTCGSGEEQGLAGARLALAKAFSGQQVDTYSTSAIKQEGSFPAEWPHDKSQMVLVFVGDEDDCSSPPDPSGGVVLYDPAVMDYSVSPPRVLSGQPGDDACEYDGTGGVLAKRYDVASQYVNYFLGQGRPVVAAFIESAAETQCGYDPDGEGGPLSPLPDCSVGKCCQYDCPNVPNSSTTCAGGAAHPEYSGVSGGIAYYCGGQAKATRFFDAASQIEANGAKVFTGSVCDSNFAKLLEEISKLSIPPSGLTLPTMPASSEITVLRIIGKDGTTTRRFCGTPAPACPAPPTPCPAPTAEWWFTATELPPVDPVAVSRHVYINPAGNCKLNPGETYSAEYIGRLPEGGCVTEADCKRDLLGTGDCSSADSTSCSYTCYAGTKDFGGVNKCVTPTLASPGTCICGAPKKNCPNGKG